MGIAENIAQEVATLLLIVPLPNRRVEKPQSGPFGR